MSDEELAEVVDQFERLAYDVVVAGGGRVVKMIGDEVMFLVDDPVVRGRDRARAWPTRRATPPSSPTCGSGWRSGR